MAKLESGIETNESGSYHGERLGLSEKNQCYKISKWLSVEFARMNEKNEYGKMINQDPIL